MYSALLHFPFSNLTFSRFYNPHKFGCHIQYYFSMSSGVRFGIAALDSPIEASWNVVSWFLPRVWGRGSSQGRQSRGSVEIVSKELGFRRRGPARRLTHEKMGKNREQDKLCTQNKSAVSSHLNNKSQSDISCESSGTLDSHVGSVGPIRAWFWAVRDFLCRCNTGRGSYLIQLCVSAFHN